MAESYLAGRAGSDPLSSSPVFFLQAEDGIRDYKVTGVQTCALPILGQSQRAVAVVLQQMKRHPLRGFRTHTRQRAECDDQRIEARQRLVRDARGRFAIV